MSENEIIRYRERQVSLLTVSIGVYALYDLDDVAIYVGQTVSISERGIRGRVQRHLTSARSDMIANRQLDVWEIAHVRAWPESNLDMIDDLEAALFIDLDTKSTLMNGKRMNPPRTSVGLPLPTQHVQVMPDNEIALRRNPTIRLPRQVEHYGQLLSHYLAVKDSRGMARSMRAHFERMSRYHSSLLAEAGPELVGSSDD
jgi:hypothetical protein